MGVLGRLGEKLRQAFGCGADRDWKPTSNARNSSMLKEAKKFAQKLRLLHSHIVAWRHSVEDGLEMMKDVLDSPLPRAFHETAMGVEPIDPHDRVVGQNVRTDALPHASETMGMKLQEEVLHPLEQWLAAYKTIKERNKKCQVLRLDLDAQTREAVFFADKYQKLAAKGEESDSAEGIKYKMHNAEDKRSRLQQRYTELEAEIYSALLTLVTDTTAVREHAAAALHVMQNTFASSYGAFDLATPVRPPMMPSFEQPSKLASSVLIENSKTLRQSMAVTPAFHGAAGAGAGPPGNSAYLPSSSEPMGGPIAQRDAATENPFATPGMPGPARASQKPDDSNPFAPAAKASSPSQQNSRPPPPAWYIEARAKAQAPNDDGDSDDEGNPFAAGGYASQPGSRPGTIKGPRRS